MYLKVAKSLHLPHGGSLSERRGRLKNTYDLYLQ